MSDIFSFGSTIPTNFDNLSLPPVDLSSLTSGLQPPINLMPTADGGILASFNDFARNFGDVAKTIYGTQAQIAQAQAQAAIAKAQGQNAVKTAQAGVPSPNILILGAFGLAALLLVTSKK